MIDTTDAAGFKTIPERLYLDTQFCFAYHVQEDTEHNRAQRLSDGLKVLSSAGLVACFVSVLALDELTWKMAGAIYDREYGPGQWRRTTGRKKRAAFMDISHDLASIVEDFLSETWIRPLPIEENAYAMLPAVMRAHDLRPADLCHLALAWAAGCGIVTNDRDFHTVEDGPVEIVGY